jgi:hypothetical protein
MKKFAVLLSLLSSLGLAACGSNGGSQRTFAIATPATQLTFQNINAMKAARSFHTATLLNDGRVLVVGGKTLKDVTASAEIFDPQTGTWTNVGSLKFPRMNHAATLLDNGDVLIIGGQSDQNGQNALQSTAIFNVSSLLFSAGPNLSEARSCPITVRISQGGQNRLMVAGGSRLVGRTPLILTSVEMLSLNTGLSKLYGNMNESKMCSSAVVLPGDKILIEGGWTGLNRPGSLQAASPELLDLNTGRFTQLSQQNPRAEGSLTIVQSRPISVGGRTSPTAATNDVANFDNLQWTNTNPIIEARWNHRAVELGGDLLIIGGRDDLDALVTTEVISGQRILAGSPLITARSAHTATKLQNNQILVSGGENSAGIPLSATEILAPAGSTVAGTTPVIPAPGTGAGTGTVSPGAATVGPTISTINPSSGPVGTVITINGTNFSSNIQNNTVEIGGIPAVVTNASTASLTVVVANNGVTGAVAVDVNGQSSTGPVFTVTGGTSTGGTSTGGASTGPRPEILFAIPNSAAAFVPVAITGRNFGSSPKAIFSGTPAINIISLKLVTLPLIGTVYELITLVPAGARTGDLVVEANGQRSPGLPFTVN